MNKKLIDNMIFWYENQAKMHEINEIFAQGFVDNLKRLKPFYGLAIEVIEAHPLKLFSNNDKLIKVSHKFVEACNVNDKG